MSCWQQPSRSVRAAGLRQASCCCTHIHKVLVKVRAASVGVPRVVEAFLGDGVGVTGRENLALHRLEGKELRGVVGKLADRVVC